MQPSAVQEGYSNNCRHRTNANAVEVLYGNYNGVSSNPVTPLEGIRNRASAMTKILFVPGSNAADEFPILLAIPEDAFLTGRENENGLKAEYFNTLIWRGLLFFTRVDKQVDFDFIVNPPVAEKDEKFSVR